MYHDNSNDGTWWGGLVSRGEGIALSVALTLLVLGLWLFVSGKAAVIAFGIIAFAWVLVVS